MTDGYEGFVESPEQASKRASVEAAIRQEAQDRRDADLSSAVALKNRCYGMAAVIASVALLLAAIGFFNAVWVP